MHLTSQEQYSVNSDMARALLLLAVLTGTVCATSDMALHGAGSYLMTRQGAFSNHSRFSGYQIYTNTSLSLEHIDGTCEQALTSLIACDDHTLSFQSNSYRGSLDNDTLTASVCDPSCGASLEDWFTSVTKACSSSRDDATLPWQYAGGRIWAGWNETCLKDSHSDSYCNGKSA